MRFEFNWPARELSPNWRGHWSKKAKAAKAYRADCFYIAKLAGVRVGWTGDIFLLIEFNPPSGPNGRRHDRDNCLASIKAGLDGLADALEVNDRLFRPIPIMGDPVKGGLVIISITNRLGETGLLPGEKPCAPKQQEGAGGVQVGGNGLSASRGSTCGRMRQSRRFSLSAERCAGFS